MLGYEAALFAPSGTICNQIAVPIYCRAGDEMGLASHIDGARLLNTAIAAGIPTPDSCSSRLRSAVHIFSLQESLLRPLLASLRRTEGYCLLAE